MTKRWNNDENDENDRKIKNVEERKTWQISHMNQDILKRYDKVKRGQNDKKGQKEDKKRTKRWKDDEMMTFLLASNLNGHLLSFTRWSLTFMSWNHPLFEYNI